MPYYLESEDSFDYLMSKSLTKISDIPFLPSDLLLAVFWGRFFTSTEMQETVRSNGVCFVFFLYWWFEMILRDFISSLVVQSIEAQTGTKLNQKFMGNYPIGHQNYLFTSSSGFLWSLKSYKCYNFYCGLVLCFASISSFSSFI